MVEQKCLYCGNNPVPHRLTWFNETMTISLGRLSGRFMSGAFARMIFVPFERLGRLFGRVSERLGLIAYHDRPSDRTNDRAKFLWEEADRRGIKMQRAIVLGRDNDQYRAIVQGRTVKFSGLPRPEGYPGSAEWWMDDKGALRRRLEANNIPMPRGGVFSRYRPLLKRFNELEKPVIIKPRLGSRGRHTTTFIYTEDQLEKAFRIAKQLCHWVIMEEHLTGSVYRGTLIGGKLAGVLGGHPPRVTGDGVHTIRELVKIKNQNRSDLIKDALITDHTHEFLSRTNRTVDDVLPEGVTIDLTEKIGVSYGGHSFEITEETHPETKRVLEAAAAAVGDPMLGFDFIIEDIRRSPHEQKWGIIECNGLPFINLHHDPVEGTPQNVAKWVWDFVENNLKYY